MSLIKNNVLAGSAGSQDFLIDESLRFNASQSSYLSWTPASAGNQKTWTWSCWVKRGTLGAATTMFSVDAATGGDRLQLLFTSTDTIQLLDQLSGGNNILLETTQVFRDPSAWYHVVALVDTTQATSTDRVKIYINGTQVTSLTASTYPTQNNNTWASAVKLHAIGARAYAAGTVNLYHDGYLTEINFIDGQALDASSFGETDAVTGVWKPKKYVGTYGTNGFYLPMKLDNTVEGFNTVTYIGNGSKQQIRGVGFSPDLVWMKSRTSGTDNHYLANSVSGVQKALFSNLTNAEATDSNGLLSFDTDGFTIGTQAQINTNTVSHVAWCWDAGNSTVSNSDGSITSSVRANPTYGFSIVTYTGNNTSGATIGHGLGIKPSFLVVKKRTGTDGWGIYHTSLGATKTMELNTTAGQTTTAIPWNNTEPTSSVIYLNGNNYANSSLYTYVMYCFAEISGYSKFGSYTGNGSASGPTVTLGWKPAMVLIKRTDAAGSWYMYDNTRDAANPSYKWLSPNQTVAENTNSGTNVWEIDLLDNGFQIKNDGAFDNASGGTYIYMAFKDTREYAYWLDDSGNNNDWQPNGGITTQSSVTDVPTLTSETAANYATLNPLDQAGTLSSGNLEISTTSASWKQARGTIGINSGKWYWETTLVSGTNYMTGISKSTGGSTYPGANADGWGYAGGASGTLYNNGSGSSYGAGYTAGDVIGIALDLDAGTLTFYKNGSSQGQAASGLTGTWFPSVAVYASSGTTKWAFNVGQLPFAYTPPTGFKALNTYNLPDSTVADGSDYFNTVLYTGNGGTQTITGVGFNPDWVWIKNRTNATANHNLVDVLRGNEQALQTNTTNAESNQTGNGTSLTTDGFILTTPANGNPAINGTSNPLVAWNWKANGSGVSNTDGTITSTVSANTTAGFSIVTWAGQSAQGSIGLGISNVGMIISKRRNEGTADWPVLHQSLSTDYGLFLNKTNAQFTLANSWVDYSTFGSSVLTLRSGSTMNQPGTNHLAYCFAEVEGFSKIGSYTGNGSTTGDGTFVYTGFRPAFLLLKNSSNATGYNWVLIDSARNTYNVADTYLVPNNANADTSGAALVDFVSNGIKLKTSGAGLNSSGNTYIYLAFAENPFKNSLAR